MPDPQDPRTGGIPCWDYRANRYAKKPGPLYRELFDGYAAEEYRAFPLAEAESILAVVEKAREFLAGIDDGRIDTLALRNAVEALDA